MSHILHFVENVIINKNDIFIKMNLYLLNVYKYTFTIQMKNLLICLKLLIFISLININFAQICEQNDQNAELELNVTVISREEFINNAFKLLQLIERDLSDNKQIRVKLNPSIYTLHQKIPKINFFDFKNTFFIIFYENFHVYKDMIRYIDDGCITNFITLSNYEDYNITTITEYYSMYRDDFESKCFQRISGSDTDFYVFPKEKYMYKGLLINGYVSEQKLINEFKYNVANYFVKNLSNLGIRSNQPNILYTNNKNIINDINYPCTNETNTLEDYYIFNEPNMLIQSCKPNPCDRYHCICQKNSIRNKQNYRLGIGPNNKLSIVKVSHSYETNLPTVATTTVAPIIIAPTTTKIKYFEQLVTTPKVTYKVNMFQDNNLPARFFTPLPHKKSDDYDGNYNGDNVYFVPKQTITFNYNIRCDYNYLACDTIRDIIPEISKELNNKFLLNIEIKFKECLNNEPHINLYIIHKNKNNRKANDLYEALETASGSVFYSQYAIITYYTDESNMFKYLGIHAVLHLLDKRHTGGPVCDKYKCRNSIMNSIANSNGYYDDPLPNEKMIIFSRTHHNYGYIHQIKNTNCEFLESLPAFNMFQCDDSTIKIVTKPHSPQNIYDAVKNIFNNLNATKIYIHANEFDAYSNLDSSSSLYVHFNKIKFIKHYVDTSCSRRILNQCIAMAIVEYNGKQYYANVGELNMLYEYNNNVICCIRGIACNAVKNNKDTLCSTTRRFYFDAKYNEYYKQPF